VVFDGVDAPLSAIPVLDASFVLCSDTGVTVFAAVSVRADSACSLPAPDSAGELLSGAMAFATADGLFSSGFAETWATKTKKNSRIDIENKRGAMARPLWSLAIVCYRNA